MKILVVDDLAENRYLLEQLLRGTGHEVVSAADGVEALSLLPSAGFELVISDIMMPRMDGFELCYNVKSSEKLKHIPFVFYTATFTTDQDRAFGLSLGAEAFILKPEEPERFIEHLKEAVAKAGTHRPPGARLTADQFGFLREYNARLVAKLNKKVTEARAATERLRDLNENLEKRIAEKTEELLRSNSELEGFAQTLSHDLRAPLRSIGGFAGLVGQSAGKRLTDEEKAWLAKIGHAVQRMDRMMTDVLAFSRREAAITPSRVDVDAVVREIVQSEPKLQSAVEIRDTLLPMLGHETSLQQAVSNLLNNAVKFVAPGVNPRVVVHSENREDVVRLWIDDNGFGIPAEQHTRIFGLFERLHTEFEGTGIGLAIVAKAMKRMNGSVGVESEPGKGSRFWLELPRP